MMNDPPKKEEDPEQKSATKALELALSLFDECSGSKKQASSLLKRPKLGELKSELFELTAEEDVVDSPQWPPRPASAMLKQLTPDPSASFDPSSFDLIQWPDVPASSLLKKLTPNPSASYDPSSFDLIQWSEAPGPASSMLKQLPSDSTSIDSASLDQRSEALGPASAMLKQLLPDPSASTIDPSSFDLIQLPNVPGPASLMLKQVIPSASFDPSSFDLASLEEVSGEIEEQWFPRISWPTDDNGGEDSKASDEAFTSKMMKKKRRLATVVAASFDSSSSFSSSRTSESADQLMPLGMKKKQKGMKRSGPALTSLADAMKQAAYDHCPSVAPEAHMIAEYSSPVIVIMLFHYTNCTWLGYAASVGIVLLHTLETYCTNFGGTDCNNNKKKLLDKLQHYLCDCVLMHSLMSFLFLMPQAFGPYSFELGLGLLQAQPVYALIVFKSHFLYELGNTHNQSGAPALLQEKQQHLLGRHAMKCFLAYLFASCFLVLSRTHDDIASIAFFMAGLITFNLSPYVLYRSYKQQFMTRSSSSDDDAAPSRQPSTVIIKKRT